MILRALSLAVIALWPLVVAAQDGDQNATQNGAQDGVETGAGQPVAERNLQTPDDIAAPPDQDGLDDWEDVATRAEDLALRDDASRLAVSRSRAELVDYRDRFLEESNENASRIATVDAQLEALGPVPENGEEAASVADRRAALQAQRRALEAPAILAREAYARANGLIGEFDARTLAEQTSELTRRGPSPLSPGAIAGGVIAALDAVVVTATEVSAAFQQRLAAGTFWGSVPAASVFLLFSIVCLGMGRRQITTWRGRLETREGWLLPVWLFGLSLLQIAVPLFGLVLLQLGLERLDIFGLRSGDVVAALPRAGFVVVFTWWLGRQIFPGGPVPSELGYDRRTAAAARRYAQALAWLMAVGVLFDAALQTVELTDAAVAAMEWPLLVLGGVLLWRLGRAIGTAPVTPEDQPAPLGSLRGLLGRCCTLVAVGAPLVAAFGYAEAGRFVMVSAILSLGLIGLLLVLQRMVRDLFEKGADPQEPAQGLFALLPVLISFVIYLLSLPVFGLIWGMRTDELIELWARFREGLSLGETRISPADFLAFALVFAIGYMLTRFIQSTLRKSVMPRTRLDLGGQNAIVAGVGYVGIIVAAIIAITSAGIDLSSLAIVAGALSVGIGFGLQNIVSNFVSGIILLIERPISEGDWIEAGGQMGYVRAISVRSTRIETFDRTDVIIPNADLVSGQVINWTRGNLVGRVIVPVGVAYGSDVDKVTQILKDVAETHPMVVMTPPPSVLFLNFGADALEFEIRAILRDVNYVMVTKSEINAEIAKRFAQADIEIPFAQRDIWLRNPEVLKGDQT